MSDLESDGATNLFEEQEIIIIIYITPPSSGH